jgi:hypothetical protein
MHKPDEKTGKALNYVKNGHFSRKTEGIETEKK